MSAPNQFLSETHIIGPECRERALDNERFPILKNAPFIWVGYSVLKPPYRIVRLNSVHSHIIVSVSGKGRTLIDGQSVDWEPRQALLGPVGKHHGFEIAGSEPWTIAWIFFDDHPSSPALKGQKVELVDSPSNDFETTVSMLLHEASGPAQPNVMAALVTILDANARRLAGSEEVDQRLWKLWEKVESNLAYPWTTLEMSRSANMSEEHLRRLCQKDYQRSPMRHLTKLRMSRASVMLKSSTMSIEEIASKVGYASVYSFSAAFKRQTGYSPGKTRSR
ncbi:helix-turn-helix transcriptional regulator [Pelagicoccus albus]|uniref:AraC family transcriptional regulator n=1 Tax=Pelagicoccus albus TaxID=415222 RepID=A0A7X1E7T2_9BACT|nr:helix-turn-helix transcriptional regulator [Pelagicoccus albus]MBC2606095.1 AraC family transcriptional regulator [Pelagicoccus albus]